MGGDGEEELKEALSTLLDQNKAKQYLLQSSDEDKVVVIPFNNSVIDIWEANQLSRISCFTAKCHKLSFWWWYGYLQSGD